jgi:[acyl-carrier-protein] S-malonyltransferase
MKKTVLLFAGQGAQFVGMGKDLAERYPTAKRLAEQANSVLGYDLTQVCYTGPEPDLTKTENAQPGIFLVSWMAYELLKEQAPNFGFQAAAGLSLGEFTALAAAGVFSFEAGLQIVRQRGRFMQEACEAARGSMAAIIGLEVELTREVCTLAGVSLANLNCPGQLVISGETVRIAQACELAKARGAKRALPLPVAGAYHSPLMASAQPKLQSAMASVSFCVPTVPVMANVTAQPHGSPEQIREALVQQVVSSVRWEESIRGLRALGFERFIELGPGMALSGFMKRIDKDAEILNVGDVASLEATIKSLSA